jgi:hypothetical protein
MLSLSNEIQGKLKKEILHKFASKHYGLYAYSEKSRCSNLHAYILFTHRISAYAWSGSSVRGPGNTHTHILRCRITMKNLYNRSPRNYSFRQQPVTITLLHLSYNSLYHHKQPSIKLQTSTRNTEKFHFSDEVTCNVVFTTRAL